MRGIDEQDGIRPHIRIFMERERIEDRSMPLHGSTDVRTLQKLPGG